MNKFGLPSRQMTFVESEKNKIVVYTFVQEFVNSRTCNTVFRLSVLSGLPPALIQLFMVPCALQFGVSAAG